MVGVADGKSDRVRVVSAFSELASIPPKSIWDGAVARAVEGDRLTFSVIEFESGSVVPEHHHENEQVGLLVRGSITLTAGGETRELVPGGTWCIRADVAHSAEVGAEGAVVIEVFAPGRSDWETVAAGEPRLPQWP